MQKLTQGSVQKNILCKGNFQGSSSYKIEIITQEEYLESTSLVAQPQSTTSPVSQSAPINTPIDIANETFAFILLYGMLSKLEYITPYAYPDMSKISIGLGNLVTDTEENFLKDYITGVYGVPTGHTIPYSAAYWNSVKGSGSGNIHMSKIDIHDRKYTKAKPGTFKKDIDGKDENFVVTGERAWSKNYRLFVASIGFEKFINKHGNQLKAKGFTDNDFDRWRSNKIKNTIPLRQAGQYEIGPAIPDEDLKKLYSVFEDNGLINKQLSWGFYRYQHEYVNPEKYIRLGITTWNHIPTSIKLMVVIQSYGAGPGWSKKPRGYNEKPGSFTFADDGCTYKFKASTALARQDLKAIGEAFEKNMSVEAKDRLIKIFWINYIKSNMYIAYSGFKTNQGTGSGGARKFMMANLVLNWKDFLQRNFNNDEYFDFWRPIDNAKKPDWYFEHGDAYKQSKQYGAIKDFLDPRKHMNSQITGVTGEVKIEPAKK